MPVFEKNRENVTYDKLMCEELPQMECFTSDKNYIVIVSKNIYRFRKLKCVYVY